ncbi:MAG: bacillithiol biosynthesis deacetylase BshB1 [Candidatus Aminicenantes bacterium]|nr:bacillithiol biosynthesis deacetylase BshB1 [Candidatus Aminicenantes bacterium]MDH5714872.1 bacillithiol biosynthesis deacetylase BshB1 [Candidatus Aminicenantes bacterium]
MELDILAFAAHPDDIELTCSGTIIKSVKKGYRVGAIDLTQGELGTRGTAEQRKVEAAQAGEIMGLSVRENLGLPDGNIEINKENKLKIIRLLRRYRPLIIFVPYWRCRHYDHAHCSQLVSEAAFYSGLVKIETGEPPFRPKRVIYYRCRSEFTPSFVVDITPYFHIKWESIMAYKSQFSEEAGVPGVVDTGYFLETIKNISRYYGSLIGVEYGEPFIVKEALEVDDPVDFFRNISPERVFNTPGR